MLWRTLSDADVIARARKNLEQFDRWGRWLRAWHIALTVAMGLALGWIAQRLFDSVIAAVQNRGELVFGLIVGVVFGFAVHYFVQMLVTVRLANVPDQRDRLLVQYHDALSACVRERSAADAAGAGAASH